MDSFDSFKNTHQPIRREKQPRSTLREKRMNKTSRNKTQLNQSFSQKNNTTGRLEYFPKLPFLYQESSKKHSSEYLTDYTKAIVLCEDFFIQNKLQRDNSEEYKRRLLILIKGLFRSSYRLALLKEIEKYIDFCLMKELNSMENPPLKRNYLNSQLYSLKEDDALMNGSIYRDKKQYNGMKPVLALRQIRANVTEARKHGNGINKRDDRRMISFKNDCVKENSTITLKEKNSPGTSVTEIDKKAEQMDFITKLLEQTGKKPKRKKRTAPSLQKDIQNTNSLFGSGYSDTNNGDCSFQLSSNNRISNKSNTSFNLSETSLNANNPNSKYNAHQMNKTQVPSAVMKSPVLFLSSSNSTQNISSKKAKALPTEWKNRNYSPFIPKQSSEMSLKEKSSKQYQHMKLSKRKSSGIRKYNNSSKPSSLLNYQQIAKPKKGKLMSLITTVTKQPQSRSMCSLKNSTKEQFDLNRRLSESKKKMTLKHIVLYFSLRLKINSLLIILLKTSSVYNKKIKRRIKVTKPTHGYSRTYNIQKHSNHSPYKKVILPVPSFTKGNQPNGKVHSSNESSISLKRPLTFK